MTFSSNNRNALNKSISMLSEIIQSEGFEINYQKTRIMGPRMHCTITGLVKNSAEPRFGVGREKKREMRAVMHSIASGKTPTSKYNTYKFVEGWLAFLRSVDPISHRQMEKYWKGILHKFGQLDSEEAN